MVPSAVRLSIDGRTVEVTPGTTVAAAVLRAGVVRFRPSVGGEPRGPLCGMGTCFECVVDVDGEGPIRSCLTICRDGMEVTTGARPD